jgi:hypothetical protein
MGNDLKYEIMESTLKCLRELQVYVRVTFLVLTAVWCTKWYEEFCFYLIGSRTQSYPERDDNDEKKRDDSLLLF